MSDEPIRQLYTPAQLAELAKVPLAVIRRWQRRGLIVPAETVRKLPYFDFEEVATARRLAELLAAGVSLASIKRQLAELSKQAPHASRPLAQLSVIVRDKRLLLRQGEGLVDTAGQMRIDFEALDELAADLAGQGSAAVLPLASPELALSEADTSGTRSHLSPFEMYEQATELEDEDRLPEAVEMIRAALAAGGPQPEVCFRLAELLYRLGDLAGARERYFMAIELDEDFVEARANLGCVLAELGDQELAIAAFNGALAIHPDYADVHYQLARLLDERGETADARQHWAAFAVLSAEGPWLEEARERLMGRE